MGFFRIYHIYPSTIMGLRLLECISSTQREWEGIQHEQTTTPVPHHWLSHSHQRAFLILQSNFLLLIVLLLIVLILLLTRMWTGNLISNQPGTLLPSCLTFLTIFYFRIHICIANPEKLWNTKAYETLLPFLQNLLEWTRMWDSSSEEWLTRSSSL